MSRSLNKCEQKYSAVKKESSAIIEATRKWSQFLKGRHFTLVTDQSSVAFMFDQKNRGKIKNTKIMSGGLSSENWTTLSATDLEKTTYLRMLCRVFAHLCLLSPSYDCFMTSWGILDSLECITLSARGTYPIRVKKQKTLSKNAGLFCDSDRDFLTPHRNVLLRRLGRGNVCRSTSRGITDKPGGCSARNVMWRATFFCRGVNVAFFSIFFVVGWM